LILLGIVVLLIPIANHERTVRQVLRGELPYPSIWSVSVILSLILAGLGVTMAIHLVLV
jgi:hypothetical protein